MNRKSDSIASAMTRRSVKPKKEKVEYCADLPSSIITHILLQLPIKAIFVCKCVCRTWNALILDPYFVKLYSEPSSLGFMVRTSNSRLVSNLHLFEHQTQKLSSIDVTFDPRFKIPHRNVNRTNLLHSYPEEDKFHVVNSCNGLLLLCEPNLRTVNNLVVCNPITGEFITLPKAITRIPICAGLGFQPKTNEYKVIRMWKTHSKSNSMVVEMHTLGTTTWRNIEVDPMFSSWRLKSPASVNGALHWINSDNRELSILCLNLESERFQSFPYPPASPIDVVLSITIYELKGCLYLCEKSLPSTWSVWLMKKYGIDESWTKVFCTDNFVGFPPFFGLFKPIKHFENGCGALLLQKSHICTYFAYYEPDKHRLTYFDIDGAESTFFESILHIPSLISLKDLAKGNKVEVQNVHFMVRHMLVPILHSFDTRSCKVPQMPFTE